MMFGIDDDEVPDKMDPSSETPYMRRSRAVAVRQSRVPQGIRRFVWWGGVIIFILVPLGAGGYLLGAYLLTSPRFQVAAPADVVVEGNHYVSKEEVLTALGVHGGNSDGGSNIFRKSLAEREEQVESIPWVQTATVVRSYPHHLVVYVTERKPVAFVDVGSRILMVDQQGVVLDPPEKGRFNFPVIKGLDFRGSPADRRVQLNLYKEFIRETAAKMATSGWTISEVDLSDASNLKALLVQNGQTLLVYFGDAGFLKRFENLMTVLLQLRRTNARIDSVDLRFRDQVVVNPAEPDSGSSRAGGTHTTGKKGI
jgi:cell division protein FtsQ